jgi:hypothetical protein
VRTSLLNFPITTLVKFLSSFKMKKKSENSFVPERVYIIFLLQHWANSSARSLRKLYRHRLVSVANNSGLQLILEAAFTISLGIILIGIKAARKQYRFLCCLNLYSYLQIIVCLLLHKRMLRRIK